MGERKKNISVTKDFHTKKKNFFFSINFSFSLQIKTLIFFYFGLLREKKKKKIFLNYSKKKFFEPIVSIYPIIVCVTRIKQKKIDRQEFCKT